MRSSFLILLLLFVRVGFAQYPPAAGQDGSTAVHADSLACNIWATSCTVYRGWVDISDTTLGKTTSGTESDATGKADNVTVSLGDGGMAVVRFAQPLSNGAGPDMAVFENSFNDDFLELAFVEVSSDGQHFVRFPSVSLTPVDSQVTTFGVLDPTRIHNLAGKYRVMYGTPFDFDDLPVDPQLDLNHITHVRITDVVGSIDTAFATYDSQGNPVNDPWPTPFPTGGFDLDAVAGINAQCHVSAENGAAQIQIYPNPCAGFFFADPGNNRNFQTEILSTDGKVMLQFSDCTGKTAIPTEMLNPGLYFIKLYSEDDIQTFPLILIAE